MAVSCFCRTFAKNKFVAMKNEKMPEGLRRKISEEATESAIADIFDKFEPIDAFPDYSNNQMQYNAPGGLTIKDILKNPVIMKEREIVHESAINALLDASIYGRRAVEEYLNANSLYFDYIHSGSGHPASASLDPMSIPGWSEWVKSLQ